MNLIERATQIAVQAHKEQVRKSDGSPYIVHPIMVAYMLGKYGFPDAVVAAGLVHDVLEDTTVTEAELVEALGEEVVAIVRAVSEDKDMPWEERKKQYARTMADAPEGIRAVSLADKIHNAQSMLEAHAQQGPALWSHFNRGRSEQLWFVHQLLSAYRENWEHPMIDIYARLVADLDQCD
jgi:guanosine-3',5'-bis(diphosphate) 3'-pyrophosphohydrolase